MSLLDESDVLPVSEQKPVAWIVENELLESRSVKLDEEVSANWMRSHNYTLTPPFTHHPDSAARIKELEAEVERLKVDAESRYVEQVLTPIRRILDVAKAAEALAENSEHVEDQIRVVTQLDFDRLSKALDALDELPDDKPGYVLGGAAKASWALRDIIRGQK